VSGPEPGHLDSRGIWEATADLPDRLEDALAAAGRAWADLAMVVAAPPDVDAVVVLGRGSDALAGEAVAALAAAHSPVPVLVVSAPASGPGSALPVFAGPRTLVIAVSSSGRDADTLANARAALDRGCRAAVVAAEGPLSALAVEAGVPWCPVASSNTPRTLLGPVTVSVLAALERVGLVPNRGPSVTAAAGALRKRCEAFAAPGGPAAEVARRIGRTIPVVYGAAGVGAVAARRWKAQVNLNAKSPAFSTSVQAATRDELAGWGQGGDVTRQVMSLVLLRHAGEDPAAAALFNAVAAATDEVMADVMEVRAEGDDDLTCFLDLVAWGDFVSLFLAAREGVDPGPVPVIEDLGAGPS
jgi:glucose/mannose-6-phosphate isomerase